MTREVGLRERKKAATRRALSRTAWSMMLANGLEAVTPEAVAAAADMAPRTFRYHFRSREEAILDELAQQHRALADQLRDRPEGEPVWESLLAFLPEAIAGLAGDRAEFAELLTVLQASPALLAENLRVLELTRQLLAEVISERTGRDLRTDTYPGLMAGVVITVIGTSVAHWATGDDDAALPGLIRDCLAQMRAGLR
ncbi:TetR family transcriptional regulator [Actinoplanes sp. NPDC048796]|uniref:TetR/AcrR family transcriptional regulator n=1 Tax=unclassified Actinoplanes TaxID=2626549 RepID=UPI0033DF061E